MAFDLETAHRIRHQLLSVGQTVVPGNPTEQLVNDCYYQATKRIISKCIFRGHKFFMMPPLRPGHGSAKELTAAEIESWKTRIESDFDGSVATLIHPCEGVYSICVFFSRPDAETVSKAVANYMLTVAAM